MITPKQKREAFIRGFCRGAEQFLIIVAAFVLICAVAALAGCSEGATVNSGAMMAKSDFTSTGVPDPVAAQLASYYKDATARLKKVVLHPPGGTQASREYRQAWAANQIQQLDRYMLALKGKASGWVGKNIPAAMTAGVKLAHEQAVDAGVKTPGALVEGSFSLIDQHVVRTLAIDTVADLHRAADSIADRGKSVLRQTAQQGLAESEINKILAGGVIEGRPLDTIRRLKAELEEIHGETVEVNGKNFDVGYYAEMVARTKTRQATVVARHERLGDLGLDLVAIIGRLSDNFCSAFLGQVFSLSGKSTKYPAYASLPGGGPPFHPNCSKSTRPFIEELASDSQLDRASGVEDAQTLLQMKPTEAQRAYKDLQIRQQIAPRHATTAEKLFA